MDHVSEIQHEYNKRVKIEGCYETIVSNPNAIWKSDSILTFYLPFFTAQVALMLITTRSAYYILRPLNQPLIVVEILIGFMISPEIIGGTPFYGSSLVPLRAIIPIETMTHFGLVFFVFIAGLDMNLDTILHARKKATSIAVAGIIIPMAMGSGIYYLLQSMYKGSHENLANHNTFKAYLFWTLTYSVTGFPIVSQILTNLKLLYTGLGRVALTAAMITDFYNWVTFALLIPYAMNEKTAIYSVIATIVFVLFCFIILRPYMEKLIIRKTTHNDWDNYQLLFVVMGAYACAFITDILGAHPVVGALVYGIIIPRGKFTEMLINKSEDLGVVYLAPIFYGNCGIRLRFLYTVRTQGVTLVMLTMFLTCIPKILSTLIATQFYGMSILDGVAVGVLMNTKGVLPLIMLNIAWDEQILSAESFSILTVTVLMMTIIVPIIINVIYKPRKLHRQNKLRTIQNLKVDSELRVLACVHNPRQTTGIINILEACNSNKLCPLRVIALQLVEMTGTTTSLLVSHINHHNMQQSGAHNSLTESEQDLETIANVFAAYAEETENTTKVETLAAVSPYSTIHEDIYNVAQEKQATLIILPFHKQSSLEGILEDSNSAIKDINQNVIRDAPCSVGIFVDRGIGSLFKVDLRVLMLFIGGPDDREALAVAWRMSKHQRIHLSVVRILLSGEAAEADSSSSSHVESKGLLSAEVDNEKQKELDDEYVNSFRLKAVNNEDSIKYLEKEVHSANDISEVLNQMDQIGCDLYILGQGTGRNSMVFSNLMKQTDCPELGVIGDMVASNNFGSCSSLLVVQQYGFERIEFETSTQQSSEASANNDGSGELFVKVE
ncbi:cation/H(+) antiporter 15-like [Lotus japonicus]|uniref:cation/H(+) antiporter 15-like n=1 Tax=Lotus japonicus TaxID=34305 RepID=UPI00258D539E|nr:cation/H(+) antiporter 15-like [Lotus japonicus]